MSNKYLVLIKGDMNDGDYKTVHYEVNEETVALIRKVAKVVLAYKGDHNWPSYEMRDRNGTPHDIHRDKLTEREIDIFDGYVPSGGDYPVHSIESVTIFEFSKKEEIR